MTPPIGANQLIEEHLLGFLEAIEKEMEADCLFYTGQIAFGADSRIRYAVEEIPNRREKLVFVLETSGGYAEDVRRISDTLRHHYEEVAFLIPSHAMSAGTILALSGNEIWMDYYSVLGPIDPQVISKDERQLVPALGYLERYNELMKKADAGEASAAELQILLHFDQGELYAYIQARNLSLNLVGEWLARYKFKNWNRTATRKIPVSEEMKKERAIEIANDLNKIQKWNSHGIGISMHRLREELNLHIDDFGANEKLRHPVRNYHRLVVDYAGKMGIDSLVQARGTFDARKWRE